MQYSLGDKIYESQSKVLFPLVHACYKDMQHSKHQPIIWAWRNRSKLFIPFLFDIHRLNTTFHSKNGCIAVHFCRIFPADWRVCFQILVVYCCLMCKLGYVPYTHKTWSQKFFRNTYLYIALQLLSLKTKTDINRCLKWLMFHIQYIKLTKDQKSALQRPGLQNEHPFGFRLGIPLFGRKPPFHPQEDRTTSRSILKSSHIRTMVLEYLSLQGHK